MPQFPTVPTASLDIAVYRIDTLQYYDAYCSTSKTFSCDFSNVKKMLQIVKQYEKNQLLYANLDSVRYVGIELSTTL